ncbi:S41 family peptidase [Longimicrobium sp.]|uniref:S41 family peptidase n=1 Tax=Longimicrobium sp. TaxID=2029185 RepID=UPI002E321377|nr:S41 family peptidase [Longimicrobium sp.]HEX6040849.1 S41 family peptidase [Longimicrobium sp.]
MSARARLLAAAALLLAAAPAAAQPSGATRPRTAYEDLQMFSQVLNQIRVNHPDSVDTHALFMAAVQGMVQAADPHSYVIPAARLSPQKEQQLRSGRLHPVPVGFRYVGGQPVVASVAPGTAAARQDILPGDVLVAIDGNRVLAESPVELEVFLAGTRGSEVRLTFERERTDGTRAELERTVKRERGEDESPVPVAMMLDAETGYVRVVTFASERAAEDLHAALERLEGQGMKRLMLDLRDNGGGVVNEATRVASEFLPAGATVYVSEGRKAEVHDSVVVRRSFWRTERQYPIVVMVNEGTASASELVAGALQDHDRAVIVGRPTFGKSLLMQGFPLSDGSMIMLTIGHIKTPCGRVIQRQYRDMRGADYYRMARAARDTVGRPSCRTAGGRTVYGGGGIYPDVVMPEAEPAPVWLARLAEDAVHTRWIGGYLTENAGAFTTAEALAATPRLPDAALAQFRAFAQQQGHAVPAGADADRALQRLLVPEIAGTKWGAAGYYRVLAALDEQIGVAAREFARAAEILGARE